MLLHLRGKGTPICAQEPFLWGWLHTRQTPCPLCLLSLQPKNSFSLSLSLPPLFISPPPSYPYPHTLTEASYPQYYWPLFTLFKNKIIDKKTPGWPSETVTLSTKLIPHERRYWIHIVSQAKPTVNSPPSHSVAVA